MSRSIQSLETVGAHVLGTVNNVKAGRDGYYQYEAHHYTSANS